MKKNTSQFQLTNYILFNVNASNSGLDMKESYVLTALSAFLNSTTLQCNPSMSALAESCHMSLRTINTAISGLIAKGYITHVRGGLVGTLRKANSYAFVYDKIYSCVRAAWKAPEPLESMVPAPPVLEPVDVVTARQIGKQPSDNEDGSKPYHTNGTRCFSFEDHRRATTKANEADEDSLF